MESEEQLPPAAAAENAPDSPPPPGEERPDRSRRRSRGGRGRRRGPASPPEERAPSPRPAAGAGSAVEPEDELPEDAAAIPARAMPPRAAKRPAGGALRFEPDERAYLFTVGPIGYRVDVGPEAGECGMLSVQGRLGDGEWQPILAEGGVFYRSPEG